jgi:hypothetical protein
MLKKILFQFQDRSQLIVAFFGALIGFCFLMLAIHYMIRVGDFGKEQEIIGSNTLIIQKAVSNKSTLGISKSDFSDGEMAHLESLPFIEKVAPIINNSFGVSLQTDSEAVPYFRSDVFVQSVAPEFLDVPLNNWNWKNGDPFVPIILPREFLVMLNTFASAKGIPQVSDDLAKSIDFKFTIYNSAKKEWYKVRILGFTAELSSILVPTSFMDYANENFPTNIPSKTTQLMVQVKDGQFGVFETYLQENGMESKKSSMIIGKLKSIATILFAVIIGISLIILLLAALVIVQYGQLILANNRENIHKLLLIGYAPKKIQSVINIYFFNLFSIILIVSTLSFTLIKIFVDQLLLEGGIQLSTNWTYQSLVVVLLAYFLLYFLFIKKVAVRSLVKEK